MKAAFCTHMCVNFQPFFTERGKKICFPLVLGILCLILPSQFLKLPYSTYHCKWCRTAGISLSHLNSNDLHLRYCTTCKVKWTHHRHDVNNQEVKMQTKYYYSVFTISRKWHKQLQHKANKMDNVHINIRLRCVPITIVAVQNQYYIFWVCL